MTYISVIPLHVESSKDRMIRSSRATVRWQGRDTMSRWTWRTRWWLRHSYWLWFSSCRGCSGWVGTVHRRRTRGPWHGIPPATWQGWKARPRFRKNDCCKSHIRNVFKKSCIMHLQVGFVVAESARGRSRYSCDPIKYVVHPSSTGCNFPRLNAKKFCIESD